jgi:uncharacterized membrane protein
MTLSRSHILAIAFVLASAALGAWAYAVLPPGAQIEVHYTHGFSGRPDGFADKLHGLFILPLVSALVVFTLSVAGALGFRRRAFETSPEAYGAVLAGVPAVLFAAQGAIIAHAFDPAFDVLRAAFLAVGALLVVVGNLLGKLRQNYVLGIRTPWSLTDAENWDKTHRFTGRLMLAAGLALIPVSVFTPSHAVLIALMVVLTAGPMIAGLVYSYRIRKPARA